MFDHLLLPSNSQLRNNFDPNQDGPINTVISEPTDQNHPIIDNITEKNGAMETPPKILHQHGGDDNEIPIYYAIRYGGLNVDFKIYYT